MRKRQNAITPVVPKANAKAKTRYNQNNKNGSKKRKSKKAKRPVEPSELPELSELLKYIQALDEYKQGQPIPAILEHFIPEDVLLELLGLPPEDGDDANSDDEFLEEDEHDGEVCCSISHSPE